MTSEHPISNSNNIVVRLYQPSDRSGVRDLCCDTADIGAPMDSFFEDRGLFADMWSSYYTDYEPESLWVADSNGIAVGYLSGCVNQKKFERAMAWRVLPKAIFSALLRGALFRKSLWNLLYLNIKLWMKKGPHLTPPMGPNTGHLHINLKKGFRGQKLGRRLMEAFLSTAKNKGIVALRVGVREDNADGRGFFEKMGFVRIDVHDGFIIPGRLQPILNIVTYEKSV